MNTILSPGTRKGSLLIPSSKSQAHRLLICAALGKENVTLKCDGLSLDIKATIDCLNALGSHISLSDNLITVTPLCPKYHSCFLPCGESGSTLRFLLPVAASLGLHATFLMEGRLPQRPLSVLEKQLTAHGITIERNITTLTCSIVIP